MEDLILHEFECKLWQLLSELFRRQLDFGRMSHNAAVRIEGRGDLVEAPGAVTTAVIFVPDTLQGIRISEFMRHLEFSDI